MSTAAEDTSAQVAELKEQVAQQGEHVRSLKAAGNSEELDGALTKLLELKRALEELAPGSTNQGRSKKKKSGGNASGDKKGSSASAASGGSKNVKKETGLSISHSRTEDFTYWYTEVITAAGMIDYYDVSGCYILRPWSFFIWEKIQGYLDGKIKETGVQNAYFPVFVTERALNAEKDHVEGFAPEVAWVTRSGQSELPEPIAIRPTSETIMYPAFANWISSHRDLPLRLNQWSNVVRWEFKHPVPFLRSREFLWQEGHTAFATRPEAEAEVLEILDIYRQVYEDLLAVPVVPGRKTEKEKFAGGDFTTTVEGYIPVRGWAIQGATSHCLGQNFAKMFNIVYEDENGSTAHVWQNSWGLTTRTIGVMVMVHGDDKGLVLPPKVAPVQVVFVPIPYKNKRLDEIMGKVDELSASLRSSGVRTDVDKRSNYTPGWKFNHWEVKGVPLRVELGPRDLDSEQVVVARRDTGTKETVSWADLPAYVEKTLATMQGDMFVKARDVRDQHMKTTMTWNEFVQQLDAGCMCLAPHCNETVCEEKVKKDSAVQGEPDEHDGKQVEAVGAKAGAKSLCIPFTQPSLSEGTPCFACQKPAVHYTLFGRSY